MTDDKFIQQLKSIEGYNLPRISEDEMIQAKDAFMEYRQSTGLEKSRVAKKHINRQLFQGMRKNYFDM